MNLLIQKWALIRNAVAKDSNDWYWFDLSGEMSDHEVIDCDAILTTCRPPYPKTAMVYKAVRNGMDHELLMLIGGDDPEAGINISMVIQFGESAPRVLPQFMYSIRDGVVHTDLPPEAPEQLHKNRDMGLQLVALLLKRLVEKRMPSYLPVVDRTFLNQRRIEKGKAPKYTWHTLVVGAETVVRDDLGGTHASPRYHDRRGHQRRLKNGKVIWVKACKVGDPSKGAVFKDYAVRTLQ